MTPPRPSWNQIFMTLAYVIAMRSPDPSTKVGAVITTADNTIVASGYNGWPRGMAIAPNDSRLVRPLKYKYFEHAERNAIYNAGRDGKPLQGCSIYVLWLPCTDCARAIVQSGIKTVYYHLPAQTQMASSGRWEEDNNETLLMFEACGVQVIPLDIDILTPVGFMDGKEVSVVG